MPLSHHNRCIPSSFFDATLARPIGKGQIRGVSLVSFEDGCAFPHGPGFSSSSSGFSFSLEEELREDELPEAPADRDELLLLLLLLEVGLEEELPEEDADLDPPPLGSPALEAADAVRLLDEEDEGVRLLVLLLEEVAGGRLLLEEPELREEEEVGSLELDEDDLGLELLDEDDDFELEERLPDDFLSSSGGGLV